MTTVAALYIDPRGPYPTIPGVVCYGAPRARLPLFVDEQRDATRYAGPHRVIAHPPCGPWGRLQHLSRSGDRELAPLASGDRELAPLAVAQVRAWGGVLEHPAHSGLFEFCALPSPGAPADSHGGRTIEVNQCDWGHPARKRTWLYIVGDIERTPPLPTPREPTHWVGGGRRRASGRGGLVPDGIKVCSAPQRRRTPRAFAEWLVALVRGPRFFCAESCLHELTATGHARSPAHARRVEHVGATLELDLYPFCSECRGDRRHRLSCSTTRERLLAVMSPKEFANWRRRKARAGWQR